MVAIKAIEPEFNFIIPDSDAKKSEEKARRRSSPNQPLLLKMLEDECHNSFRKLPDEEPAHIWNTDAVESHNQRMKKLDRKLAKYNDDIAKLKEMLLLSDQKRDVEIARCEQRENDARQEIKELKETSQVTVKEQVSTEVQYGQLKARLEANLITIRELRSEGRVLKKELRSKEKRKDKICFNNCKLEESSSSLFSSFSDLYGSQIFDEYGHLHDSLEINRDEFDINKRALTKMQEQYMKEAKERVEIQNKLAGILEMIKSSKKVPIKLANKCIEVGLECEARSNQLLAELEQASA